MKYKHLALICAIAAVSLPTINTAQAEAATPVEAHGDAVKEAVETAAAADHGKELDMFRFSLRMEKLDFIKKAMKLPPEQEKKFLDQYYPYDTQLKKLNDNRLAIISDYAAKIDNITGAEADKLVKGMFDFRKQRTALLEKYYGKIAKATSKTIAARFLQVESILQGTTDVRIGSSLPLMPE
ncbi:MAG: hypothetical protein WAW61_19265 [Methylococcaceae bacterium]